MNNASQRLLNRRTQLAATALVLLTLIVHSVLQTDRVSLTAMLLVLLPAAYQTQLLKGQMPRLLLWGLALGVAALIVFTYRSLLGKEAGIGLLLLLCALKLAELKTLRDLQVLSSLLFFLVMAAFLRGESIWVLLWAGAMVLLIFACITHAYSGVAQLAWFSLKEAGVLLAMGLPLAVFLFYFFPRIAGPLWSLPNDAQQAKSGLSDTLQMGHIQRVALSDELAFRVKFDTETAAPPPEQLYWRGPVLTQFDGLSWTALTPTAQRQSAFALLRPADEPVLNYDVFYVPNQLIYRPALETAIDKPQGYGWDASGAIVGPVMMQAERLRLSAQLGAQTAPVLLGDAVQRRMALQPYLSLPPNTNPQTLAFASQLRQQVGMNEARVEPFVQVVLQHYRNQGFEYSLEPKPHSQTPNNAVDGFLFDSKSGFCEHYAASFVVLMRAMDVPARIVTGYQGGELNRIDGWLTVRQAQAHAWAEVFDGTAWRRVDPTSAVAPWRVNLASAQVAQRLGLRDDNAAFSSSRAWLRARLEVVNTVWQQWFMGYGVSQQASLFERLRLTGADAYRLGLLMLAAVLVFMTFAMWQFRTRLSVANLHQQLLADFDAVIRRSCSRTHARNPLPKRDAAQTPQAYCRQHGVLAEQWLGLYEQAVFAQGSAAVNTAQAKKLRQACRVALKHLVLPSSQPA